MAAKKSMVEVEGLGRVVKATRHWGRRHSDAEYTVGYSAPYAVYVHEDMEARHPRGGQAKFLEQPARTQGNALAAVCRQAVKAGLPLQEGLRLQAERLLQMANQLIPVDTGFLKRSGAVRRAR